MRYIAIFLFFLIPVLVQAQQSEIHVDGEFGIDKEIGILMNELDLRQDQKITIALLLLKYASEFNYIEYEDANNMGQYNIYRKSIKQLDKDLKQILDKSQFKVYKKHKKHLRKELTKSA